MYLKLCFILFILTSGCVTHLTKQDCEQTNWTYKGEQDGLRGVYFDQLAKYEEQCFKYNVNVNRDAYINGHQSGLKKYCTYETGHSVGLSGDRSKADVCPEKLRLDFERGYLTGYEIYKVRRQVEEEMRIAREDAEREIKRSQEEALRAMNQCSFDSDCGPNMRCDSDYKTIGSASGFVNVCKVRQF